jgi:hypothetical protein
MILPLWTLAVCGVPQNLSRGKCVLDYALQILKSSKNVRCPDLATGSRTNIPPGLNDLYERQFTLVSSDSTSERTAELKHYPDGPFLLVDCCEFRKTKYYQTRALRKNSSGWHAVKTTAFCLMDPEIDISRYNRDCTRYAIREACERGDIVSPFFKLACSYSDVSTSQLYKFKS